MRRPDRPLRSPVARRAAARLALALLALLAGTSGAACGGDSPPTPSAPSLAGLDRETADLLAALRAEVERSPADANAHGKLGYGYEAARLWPDAEAAFRRAKELAPRTWTWGVHRAIALERQGRGEEARAELEALAREFPKNPVVLQRVGVARASLGDLDAAEQAYRALLELLPEREHAHFGLAQVALAREEFQAALEAADRALALAPDYRLAHAVRGGALQGLGRPEEAERELALGARGDLRYLVDPGAAEVQRYAVGPTNAHEQGLELLNRGRVPESIAVLEPALGKHPRDQRLLITLGAAYLQARRLDDAERVLADAATNQPNDPLAPYNLAACAVERGRFDEALAKLDAALALAPTHAPAHVLRGHALGRLGRVEEGVESLRRAAELDPQNRLARTELGALLAGSGRWPEAAEAWDAAVKLGPNDFHAVLELAVARRMSGDDAGAEAAFAGAEALAGGDPARAAALQNARERQKP